VGGYIQPLKMSPTCNVYNVRIVQVKTVDWKRDVRNNKLQVFSIANNEVGQLLDIVNKDILICMVLCFVFRCSIEVETNFIDQHLRRALS